MSVIDDADTVRFVDIEEYIDEYRRPLFPMRSLYSIL